MYKHLIREERYQIYSLMKANHTLTEIARLLGRHRSTISREIERGYRAVQACNKGQERAQGTRNANRVPSWVCSEVAFTLALSGALNRLQTSCQSAMRRYTSISTPTRPRVASCIRGCVAISQGANATCADVTGAGKFSTFVQSVNVPCTLRVASELATGKAIRCGAGHSQAVVTVVVRKSGYAKVKKLTNKTAELVSQAIEDVLKPLSARVKTLTVDNGKEFADYQKFDQALGIQTYFADPYCS